MGWKGAIEPSEAESSTTLALDLSVPLRISREKIRDKLGFREALSLSERVARTVEDELTRG